MTSSRPRKTKAKRLTELGIYEEHFKQYKRMFCSSRLKYGYLRWYPTGWKMQYFSWWDGLILMHLSGEESVSLFPSHRIDYIIFDLDNHDPEHNPSVKYRANAIKDTFNTDPLIYSSSDSGGLRLCYFLDQRYGRDDVLVCGQRQLEDAGLVLKAGYVEIMATTRADRLPFGDGSYLVDAFSCDPIFDMNLAGKIQAAWDVYMGEKLILAKSGTPALRSSRSSSEFNDDVFHLLEYGLPVTMATNDALLKLSYELMGKRGYSDSETEQFMRAWIRENHNNNSNRINDGKIHLVDSQIKRIITSFDKNHLKFQGLRKLDHKLTLTDVELIIRLFDKYKHQLAAFSLLEYVKNRGSRVPSDRDAASLPVTTGTSISNLYGNNFLQAMLCQIPYKSLRHFPGFDKKCLKNTLKVLECAGILSLHRREDRKSRRCRVYKVFFTFDEKSIEIVSLDEALVRLKNPQELRRDYGRSRSNLLLKGVANCS